MSLHRMKCYSPTCFKGERCYSVTCPRLEEEAWQKYQRSTHKKTKSKGVSDGSPRTPWTSQAVADQLSDVDRRWRDSVHQLICVEEEFVKDMEYGFLIWVRRLQDADVVPQKRNEEFIHQVFWNLQDIIAIHTRLRDRLLEHQKMSLRMERLGDIVHEFVPQFNTLLAYAAHQPYGKRIFNEERKSNPAFARFVEDTEFKGVELDVFLSKPIAHLARYPLLLEAITKHITDTYLDEAGLTATIKSIRDLLIRINDEVGKAENRCTLIWLDEHLTFKPGEDVDLKLNDERRRVIHQGVLMKRDEEVQVYLFDHAILFARKSRTGGLKVIKHPIPLDLLRISVPESDSVGYSPNQGHSGGSTAVSAKDARPLHAGSKTHLIKFECLGRNYYKITLSAKSIASRQKWIDSIDGRQAKIHERTAVFETVAFGQGALAAHSKINCATLIDHGGKLLFGDDEGLYISDMFGSTNVPTKVLAIPHVIQVEVLQELQLLILLSGENVMVFPLAVLYPIHPSSKATYGKCISSRASFFKAGFCLGRCLLSIVKRSATGSTLGIFELSDPLFHENYATLIKGEISPLPEPTGDLRFPAEVTSVHYLKTQLCITSTDAFMLVDAETLEQQELLDSHDQNLDFMSIRHAVKPLDIFQVHDEYLLCYQEFAFYVNKVGRRTRKEFVVNWEGEPTKFVLREPYILALDHDFVEVWHMETGTRCQVVHALDPRVLWSGPSTNNSPTIYPRLSALKSRELHQEKGFDVLMALDNEPAGLRLRERRPRSHSINSVISI